MPTSTSNMSLKTPIAGETDYATSVADSNTAIDAHDHSSGKGVPIVTGGITDLAVTTAKINDLAVTTGKLAANVLTADATGRGKMADGFLTKAKQAAMASSATAAAGELAISASCGFFTDSSGSAVDVTNLSVTLVTTGRPVFVGLIHDGSTDPATLILNATLATAVNGTVFLRRDSTDIAEFLINFEDGTNGVKSYSIPPSSIHCVDVVASGTYTYKARIQRALGGTSPSMGLSMTKLIAFEL